MIGRRAVEAELRAAARAAAFVAELMPMLPSGLLERLRPAPVREQVAFDAPGGATTADVFRPAAGAGHPGIVLCLGVVPAGLDHPQIPRLAAAAARAGFVALIHWSPAMQDSRVEPDDIGGVAAAFRRLRELPGVDPARCGLLGTCVGGAFVLLAASQPAIRDDVAFVCTFAPYSSLETLSRSIASRTRSVGATRVPWTVDPLTWRVYARTITSTLPPAEAERLRDEFATPAGAAAEPAQAPSPGAPAQAVRRLLAPVAYDETADALAALPVELRDRLRLMSPLESIDGLRAPLVSIGHDRDDLVIPVEESRRLYEALAGRPGVHYSEFGLFEHADPTKRRLPAHRRLIELARFVGYVRPLFRV